MSSIIPKQTKNPGQRGQIVQAWTAMAAIPLAFLLLYKLFGLKSVYGSIGTHFFFNNDFYNYTFPKLSLIRKMLLSGQLPLWNPFDGFGMPLFAGGAKPIFELAILLFQPVVDAVVLVASIHIFLALSFFYLFARETGRSSRAALLGAVVWTFNGYHTWYMYDLAILGINLWLPFFLFCYLRFSRGNKPQVWFLLSTLAFASQAIYGRPTDSMYALGLVFCFCLYDSLLNCKGKKYMYWPKELGWNLSFFGGMFFIGALLGAFYILPYIQNLLNSDRFDQYLKQATCYWSFSSFLEFFLPNLLTRIKGSINLHWGYEFAYSYFFFGLVALPFLILSWKSKKTRLKLFFIWAVLFPLLFIFPFGLFDLFRRLPFHGGATASFRLIPILMLGVSFLTSLGYDVVFSGFGKELNQNNLIKKKWVKRAFLTGPVLVCGVLLVGLIWVNSLLVGSTWFNSLLLGLTRLNPLRDLFIIVLISFISIVFVYSAAQGRFHQGLAFWGLLGSLLVTLFISNQMNRSDGCPREMIRGFFEQEPQQKVVKYLQAKKTDSLFRVFSPNEFRIMFWERHSLQSIFSYGAMSNARATHFRSHLTKNFYRETKLSNNSWSGKKHNSQAWLDLANIRYLVLTDEYPRPQGRYPLVFHDTTTNVSVYENTRCLPRAYLVSGFRVIEDDSAILEFISMKAQENPEWFKNNVILSEDPGDGFYPGDTSQAHVFSVHYGFNLVEMEVSNPEPAFLVFLDNFDKGWHVSIDGRKGRIIRANYIFRAVPLPQGKHKVCFKYLPHSLIVGCMISAITLVTILALLVLSILRGRHGRMTSQIG